jgi:rhodanese-related sulfurtransferase
MKPAAAAALAADGALILDLRPADAFSAGHPYGALNFAFGSKIGYWAGFVLPPDAPLLLLSDDPAQYPEAMIQLLRVGLDRVDGSITGGFRDWVGAGLPTDTIEPVAAASLHDHRPDGVTIVDVRTRREFGHGHIDRAINVPLGELPDRAGELRERGPIATICEGGYRSALAASLLAREGISPIINLVGGMHAYRGGEGA